MTDDDALLSLIRTSSTPVGLVDLSTLKLVELSESAAELIGRTRVELVDADVLTVTLPTVEPVVVLSATHLLDGQLDRLTAGVAELVNATLREGGEGGEGGEGDNSYDGHLVLLERGLAKIAGQIEALAAAPATSPPPTASLPDLPELAALTPRQVEIVGRLVRGERVPSIARSIFISASTVRNHLSAVYRVFGVHSQEELIGRINGLPAV